MKQYIKLIAILGGTYLFLVFVAPKIVALFPTWVAFVEIQEEHNIDSGALYYYHVPVTADAEIAVREGVKKGMELRKEKAMKD